MDDTIINNNSKDFWNQGKKVKCSYNSLPNNIDNCCGKEEIANLSKGKYNNLYNCVSYNNSDMSQLLKDLETHALYANAIIFTQSM